MRNMSFSATTQQIRNRSKWMTRRTGWKNLKKGERFRAIEKGQGLKKGEKVVRLAIAECVSNVRQRLDSITRQDCIAEGFPELSPGEFVIMFCRLNKCQPGRTVNVITFRYVDEKTEK